MTPLSHHEILPLVAPFAERGRHLDLAASDRRERRLVFKPIRHCDPAARCAPLTETLTLDAAEPGTYRLTRTLVDEAGLAATLQADGEDPGALLAAVLDVDPHRQFAHETGATIAYSYRIAPDPPDADVAGPRLTGGIARLGPIQALFDFRPLHDEWIPIRIQGEGDQIQRLPADFLAVLGPPWHRVTPGVKDWRASMRVARDEPARTHDGERKVARTAAHLAETFAHPPERFHPTHRQARWRAARRGIQVLLVVFALLALGPILLTLSPEASLLQMLAYFWPIALLMALPLFITRLSATTSTWPRPLPQGAWRALERPGSPADEEAKANEAITERGAMACKATR